MKIRILGAGPAGLYFAALMKCLDPSHDIAIFDRNPRDATWGFGVVFSDRALEFLKADDPTTYNLITPELEAWVDLHVVHRGERASRFAAVNRDGQSANLLLPKAPELMRARLRHSHDVCERKALGVLLFLAEDHWPKRPQRADLAVHVQHFQRQKSDDVLRGNGHIRGIVTCRNHGAL